MITLQLDIENLGVLDGLSEVSLATPGVVVNTRDNRTYEVFVPAGVPVGRFDFSGLIRSLLGFPVLLMGFTVVSSAGPYAGIGNTLRRITPEIGGQEAVQDLVNLSDISIEGMAFFSCPEVFPLAHKLGITTNVGGPHRIVCVLKPMTDEDVIRLGPGCAGGGTGAALVTQDEGVTVVPVTDTMNFTGAGVTVTQLPAGTALVDIPGGALPPLSSASFLDNATEDLPVGPDTNGYIAVEMNISKSNGESTSYRLDIAVSGTGADISTLIVDSNTPITSIDVTVLVILGVVTVRLTGTGAGIATTADYRVVDTIPRTF